MAITSRIQKGSPLTSAEVDANFQALDNFLSVNPTSIYNGVGITGQQLNGLGVVGNNLGTWSGYLPLIKGAHIDISGVDSGFNLKVFYDSSFNVISTLNFNNGVILADVIPPTADYIGFNISGNSLPNSVRVLTSKDRSLLRPFITVPKIIPVAEGVQCNIYFDNIKSSPFNDHTEIYHYEGVYPTTSISNPYQWKGKVTERALQYTGVGITALDVNLLLRDRGYNIIRNTNFKFQPVLNTAGNGLSKNILLCGDSQIDTTFDNGKTSFAPFLKDMFTQSGTVNATFLGNRNMSETVYYGETAGENRTVTCKTQGHGGVESNYFTGSSSPFWNPNKSGGAGIDFRWWMDVIEGKTGQDIDMFVFVAGVNDYNAGVPSKTIIERIKVMQNLLWETMPNCKFILGMPTLGSYIPSMDARRRWNIEFYNDLIQVFQNSEYSGKVYLAAAGLWTDNLYASRELRTMTEPYKRIVDSKNLLINKLVQAGSTLQQATIKVEDDWGLKVEERTVENWTEEYPATDDVVHSGWVGAMQQADCYYSTLKYILSL